MKLTNKQLQILVDSIYKENFASLIEKEKEVYQKQISIITPEELKVIKDYVKAGKAYHSLTQQKSSFTEAGIIENITHYRRYNINKFKSKYPTKSELESTIVLATIDAKDVADLVNAVKTKFKLK